MYSFLWALKASTALSLAAGQAYIDLKTQKINDCTSLELKNLLEQRANKFHPALDSGKLDTVCNLIFPTSLDAQFQPLELDLTIAHRFHFVQLIKLLQLLDGNALFPVEKLTEEFPFLQRRQFQKARDAGEGVDIVFGTRYPFISQLSALLG